MKKVMVAMSGGVDSSVALLLLKDKYELVGATLKLYRKEQPSANDSACGSSKDAEDAKIVANHFGIEHFIYDFGDEFKKQVIDRFNDSYFKGETPNPCIDCNRYIKFQALLEKAISLGCDYIATGHYARVEFDENSGRFLLKKAVCEDGDNSKDQSYVLYNLTQEQLSHVMFPLGHIKKSEVRKIAEENGLINHDKPDSQDICFVQDGDYVKFITEYTGKKMPDGDVVDTSGNVVGHHNGILGYTIGQRKGLGIAFGTPTYVIDKNAETNAVIVGSNEDLLRDSLTAYDVNWISIPSLTSKMNVKAKTRYKQTEQPCTIEPLENGEVFVKFEAPQRAITKGQRVVFYDGDIVVGGGVIK